MIPSVRGLPKQPLSSLASIDGIYRNRLSAPMHLAVNQGVKPRRLCHTWPARVRSVVAWIGAEMEFALSQAVASGDAFEHRPSEGGHCVQTADDARQPTRHDRQPGSRASKARRAVRDRALSSGATRRRVGFEAFLTTPVRICVSRSDPLRAAPAGGSFRRVAAPHAVLTRPCARLLLPDALF